MWNLLGISLFVFSAVHHPGGERGRDDDDDDDKAFGSATCWTDLINFPQVAFYR